MDNVTKHIPQRYPFLMVDKVEIMNTNPRCTRAIGFKAVSGNEPFFQGHFPGNPIMPGVLILEAMGQTIAYLLSETYPDKLGVFAGFDKVRFKNFVKPGDLLSLTVDILFIKHKIGKATGVARVDGNTVAKAELMFALAEKGNE